MSKSFLFLTLAGLFLAACSRPEGTSKISISFPSQASQVALPAGKKACYGVNVEGAGITNVPFGSCGGHLGTTAGFVSSGSISFEVAKGEARTFQVLMTLVDSAAACPSLNSSFTSNSASPSSTFVGDTQSNISTNTDTVTLEFSPVFPGTANSIAATSALTCPAASLKASLFSNGDLQDVSGTSLENKSSPINESFYFTNFSDPLGIGFITSGGVINVVDATAVTLPPEVHSITRKPDSGKTYGLLDGGKIVEVSIAGGVATVLDLTTECPFLAGNCEVPAWTQSISAGFGSNLYSLDHSGNIYSVGASGPVDAGVAPVDAAVTQVSFY